MADETMNVVIVGHVDHGKSTMVGRLLADTGVLGDGKLEKVQAVCQQQGKVFEYAFLLDALEEEQGQGITIDSARVFFRTDLRDYIIIDAPGHIEFLKNMVSGAARAEAAILLIDANEGVRENSKRHGYLLSMLGIKQIVVAVNKIDLVGYRREVFTDIVNEYRAFLSDIDVEPRHFIPVSARDGDMVAERLDNLPWYIGPTILEAMDGFTKQAPEADLPLRMPVQDVYKFNERGDDRRIVVGRVESGTLSVGDQVIFAPSNKASTIETIEVWQAPAVRSVSARQTTGITLREQIYVSRGEIMSHPARPPQVSTKVRVNLFWLGRKPMIPGKRYKLKLATAETEVSIDTINRILDASELDASIDKQQVERHDVADLILHTRHPVAFDVASDMETTGRFVIVDEYDIAGGGIVRAAIADDLDRQRQPELDSVRGDVRGDVSRATPTQLGGQTLPDPSELPKAVALVARACERLGFELEILDPEYNYLFEVRGPDFRRVLLGGISPLNDLVASRLAADKYYTGMLLARAGFRVPRSVRCLAPGHFKEPSYEERAGIEPGLALADELGYPVIVKPNRAGKGRDVTVVHNAEELGQAAARAFAYDSIALVQGIVPFPDIRLNFVDGEYLLGYERVPLTVTGDGERDLRALVSAEDDRFTDEQRWPDIDEEPELRPEQVPARGEQVALSGAVLNLNRFARPRHLPDIPDAWLQHCLAIGQALELRHFGIDFRGAGLDEPPERATVIEVNSSPVLLSFYDLGWREEVIQAQVRVLEALRRSSRR